MKGWIDGGMGRRVDGRKEDRRKDGWMGEDGVKMGGWKDRWMEGGKE